MKKYIKLTSLLLALVMLVGLLSGCSLEQAQEIIGTVSDIAEILSETDAPELPDADIPADSDAKIAEDGAYTTRDDVALYIHTYGHLPENFVTKKEAKAKGWPGGSLEPYFPGKCIGGDRFGNLEGLLPDADGRVWTECDINTLGANSRGAERIIFSNDGLIYYTDDHYESFVLLYGEP